MKHHIWTTSEFAPLRRVVLAQSELVFPTEISDKDLSFLPRNMVSAFKSNNFGGKRFNDVFPELAVKWRKERDGLKKILEKYGVEVIVPRRLTDYEVSSCGESGASNFFSRDPFFTIGNLLIEGSLRFRHRRKEILPIRDILLSESMDSNCYYFAVPMPDTSRGENAEAGPFLEGGDIMVLDRTVFVGNSGLASNHFGIEWLRRLLSHWDYEVVEVPLRSDVLHLDCALSLVREGLMIIAEDAFLNPIPAQLRNWERIPVDFDEVADLAVNGLPISEHTYITDTRFCNIIKALEKHGVEVETLDFSITRSLGGSFRCSTQPLLRCY